jgi:hypothetical protein
VLLWDLPAIPAQNGLGFQCVSGRDIGNECFGCCTKSVNDIVHGRERHCAKVTLIHKKAEYTIKVSCLDKVNRLLCLIVSILLDLRRGF